MHNIAVLVMCIVVLFKKCVNVSTNFLVSFKTIKRKIQNEFISN